MEIIVALYIDVLEDECRRIVGVAKIVFFVHISQEYIETLEFIPLKWNPRGNQRDRGSEGTLEIVSYNFSILF